MYGSGFCGIEIVFFLMLRCPPRSKQSRSSAASNVYKIQNIEDALYKIQSFNENNIIIPEHIDITGEVDKLLQIIAEAEDKVAVMRKYYVKKEADKAVL